MKETIVNQLLEGAKAEMDKVQLSQSYKELYRRFEINCFDFKRQAKEKMENEEREEHENSDSALWELYEKTLNSYLVAFQELAKCYYEEGFRRGFLLSQDLYR